MQKTIKKILAVVLVVLLVMNLLYVALGRINDFVFWLNLLLIFIIYYVFYGDKKKLKKFLKMR